MAYRTRREKAVGRKESHSFVRFDHRLLSSSALATASPRACKALLYLAAQYKGSNNGDLEASWKNARLKGWSSNGTLKDGIRELIDLGLVILTRQGGRNRCSLYALAWFPIDNCSGKLDVPATRVAPNSWLRLPGNSSEPGAVQLEPAPVQSARNHHGGTSH